MKPYNHVITLYIYNIYIYIKYDVGRTIFVVELSKADFYNILTDFSKTPPDLGSKTFKCKRCKGNIGSRTKRGNSFVSNSGFVPSFLVQFAEILRKSLSMMKAYVICCNIS